jgi:hypothetical protein
VELAGGGVRRSGEVEKWRSGEVEKWRSGEVGKWRRGSGEVGETGPTGTNLDQAQSSLYRRKSAYRTLSRSGQEVEDGGWG